jgi:hypothetical protein
MGALDREPAAGPVAVRSQPRPRALGAIALVLLGICGAVLLLTGPSSTRSSASLASQTNWTLATTLPKSSDFPQDWGYSLTGRLQRLTPNIPSPNGASSPPSPNPAAAIYEPAVCGNTPRILDHSGSALAALAHVDRYAQLFVQDAPPADAAATGESHEHGPNARFAIWVVPDGPAQVANYLTWLNQCGSYRVTNHFLDGEAKNRRDVTTSVETRSADGADAAVTVTRTFVPIASRDPSSTYYVAYYAVRGVLLESTIYLEGAELDQVKQIAARTLQRMRAL